MRSHATNEETRSVTIRFPLDLIARIDALRAQQPIPPSFSEAVRYLLAGALAKRSTKRSVIKLKAIS